MIEINSMEEMKKYYITEVNTYVFNDSVEFKNDIEIESSIKANNIKAYDISAYDINAWDIKANNINAKDINAGDIEALNIDAYDIDADDINAFSIDAFNISYYAICIARHHFECESAKGRRKNSIHKCLDSEIIYG